MRRRGRRAEMVRARSARRLLGAGAGAAFAFAVGCAAQAAVLTATPASSSVAAGEDVQIELLVELGAGEVASIFEADFELVGVGVVADVALEAGGPTWSQVEGNVAGGFASLSLTSSNQPGTRRLGLLTVTGVAGGVLEVRLGEGAILQRDTNSDPFIADVPLATEPETLLASIEVVPEPAATLASLAALVSLAWLARRPSAVRGA